jgi:hypothetical protein
MIEKFHMTQSLKADGVEIDAEAKQDESGFKMDMTVRHPEFAAYLADTIGTFFKDQGGVNHIALEVRHPEMGKFSLIVQKEGGRTPAQSLTEFRAALSAIKAVTDENGPEKASAQYRSDSAHRIAVDALAPPVFQNPAPLHLSDTDKKEVKNNAI